MKTQRENKEGLHLINVRLPVSLHRKLVEEAKRQQRSVNAHVNFLIEREIEKAA